MARLSQTQVVAATLIQPDPQLVIASGNWQVQSLARPRALDELQAVLKRLPPANTLHWDLRQLDGLDHVGAQLLWNAWGGRRPSQLALADQHAEIFSRLEQAGELRLPAPPSPSLLERLAALNRLAALRDHLTAFLLLVGQLMLDLLRFARRPHRGPWKELSANLYRVGYQALGITALVGFLIGVVLSFLSSQQLRTFGGDIYLVNILGMSIVRELGPLLAAILVAGRSGSAITAQLGVMRVTEELDAMLVMGLPHGFRLVLPRVLALAIAMPLLVIWTDAMAMLGGMLAAWIELGLTARAFIDGLPAAVPLANYTIGLGKAVVFGILIGLIACHFGLRIAPDTDSLGRGTTASVVSSITMVILADAIFAIVFKSVGFR